MNVARVPVFGIALMALLAGAASVRADPIQWSYNWSSSPGIVYSDSSQTSYITLTTSSILQSAAGDSDIVAANLRTYSTASPATPATFTAKTYTLSLFLVDQSGQSGTLTFTGQFDGTLSELSSNIQNTFTGATTQSIQLGNNIYTATIGPYSPPGPTNSTNAGSISAFAQVTVSPITIQDVPEPSSLLLAFLAAPLAGLAVRRRRRVKH